MTGDRVVAARLDFARGGGKSFIARQNVPYPFHVTRPHHLDREAPDLATLYLQSASGGLYRGDRLHLGIAARAGSRAHVTSQAATVVHGTAADTSRIVTLLEVAAGAVLALTTDPYILFPAADFSTRTEVVVETGGIAILSEGFAAHDPAGQGRSFARLAMECRVFAGGGANGTVLVDDAGTIEGAAFQGAASPLGGFAAMGTVMLLGAAAAKLEPGVVDAKLEGDDCLAAATPLPNGAGLGIRILARDGGRLARGLDRAFTIAVEAMLGFVPVRRRK